MKRSPLNITLVTVAILFFVVSVTILILTYSTEFQSWFKEHYGKMSMITTLNGLVGPFIGLTSAILVFLSFKAQIDANKSLQERNDRLFRMERLRFSEELGKRLKIMVGAFNNSIRGNIKGTTEGFWNAFYTRVTKEIYEDSKLSTLIKADEIDENAINEELNIYIDKLLNYTQLLNSHIYTLYEFSITYQETIYSLDKIPVYNDIEIIHSRTKSLLELFKKHLENTQLVFVLFPHYVKEPITRHKELPDKYDELINKIEFIKNWIYQNEDEIIDNS